MERQRKLRCLSLPMRRWFLTKLAAEQKEARDSAGQRKCAIMAHFRCPALSMRCPALSPRCPALSPPLPLRIFAAFAHFRYPMRASFTLPRASLRIFATFCQFWLLRKIFKSLKHFCSVLLSIFRYFQVFFKAITQ